jgi:hypothetical protein
MGLKSLLVGCGLCALTACSPQDNPVYQPMNINEAVRISTQHPNDYLSVNITNEHHSINKSKRKGLKDMLRLTQIAHLEEVFYYAKYLDGEEFWQEAGVWESNKGVYLEYKLLNKMIDHKLDTLVFSHFHPRDQVIDYFIDYTQIPSENDFYVCRDFTEYVTNLCPDCFDLLSCEIVVPGGFYTIKLNEKILNDFLSEEEFIDHISWMNNEIDMALMGDFDWFDYSVENRRNFVKLNKKFCERYSNDLVKITFEELISE